MHSLNNITLHSGCRVTAQQPSCIWDQLLWSRHRATHLYICICGMVLLWGDVCMVLFPGDCPRGLPAPGTNCSGLGTEWLTCIYVSVAWFYCGVMCVTWQVGHSLTRSERFETLLRMDRTATSHHWWREKPNFLVSPVVDRQDWLSGSIFSLPGEGRNMHLKGNSFF